MSIHQPTQLIKGAIWMLIAAMSASVMISIVRHISTDMGALQMVFMRNIIALIAFLPWVIYIGNIKKLKTTRMKIYWLRGFVGLVAMNMWFYSVIVLPLPTAVALSFSAPLITALLAIWLLKEQYGWHRWTALIVGFIGMLIVLRPGTEAFDINGLIPLASASMWALSGILIRFLSSTESPTKIAFYMVLLMTPLSLIPAIITWQPIPPHLYIWLLLLGLISNLFQIALSKAIAYAPFYTILPIDFTRLIFASILAYYLFDQVIDNYTIAGSMLIMSGAIYSAYREATKKRTEKTGD